MTEKVLEIYQSVRKMNICFGKGLSNHRETERQYLYGDISDFIRDNYNDLSREEKELLARLIIGDYVVMNCLL